MVTTLGLEKTGSTFTGDLGGGSPSEGLFARGSPADVKAKAGPRFPRRNSSRQNLMVPYRDAKSRVGTLAISNRLGPGSNVRPFVFKRFFAPKIPLKSRLSTVHGPWTQLRKI